MPNSLEGLSPSLPAFSPPHSPPLRTPFSLLQLFRPEEIELLVCGSPLLDLSALEDVAVYDGYSKDDSTVRWVGQPGRWVGQPVGGRGSLVGGRGSLVGEWGSLVGGWGACQVGGEPVRWAGQPGRWVRQPGRWVGSLSGGRGSLVGGWGSLVGGWGSLLGSVCALPRRCLRFIASAFCANAGTSGRLWRACLRNNRRSCCCLSRAVTGSQWAESVR